MSWLTASWILAALAACAFAFALFGDRALQLWKRRRRCPKCWHDLSHTQGLRCGECGSVARSERKLYKGRRSWRLALLALLIAIASYAVRVTPAVRDRGWPAAVPTTAVIVALSVMRPDLTIIIAGDGARQPPVSAGIVDRMYLDLLNARIPVEHSWWPWQRTLLDRILASMHEPEPNEWDPWPTRRDQLVDLTRWADSQQLQWSPAHPSYWYSLTLEYTSNIRHSVFDFRTPGRNAAVPHRLQFFDKNTHELVFTTTLTRSWLLGGSRGDDADRHLLSFPEKVATDGDPLRLLVQEESHAPQLRASRWQTIAVQEIPVPEDERAHDAITMTEEQ